ncbi:Sedlin_N-terminal conserved region-containing protein [Hexamita inflata]|uniref:Sedlin N-terminal conserved region-containing protein n=1 Tax=Hexamita inflata TaxID=28002 RepID=A0AA86TYV0_9EUKA|nr:Sedlin N-terminal conserved region-containing protein [Hexamita inflata]
MSAQVAILSKYETFIFSAQYNNKGQPEPIDPMSQLFFYSLLDEIYIKINKQKTEEVSDYLLLNFAQNNGQKIHCYLTFSQNIMFLSISEDISVSDDLIRQFFFNFHKIYSIELLNPFYRDGAPVASEALLSDVSGIIMPIVGK